MTKSIDDLPPEFYLPPAGDEALAKETKIIVAICGVFIVCLGAVVAMT